MLARATHLIIVTAYCLTFAGCKDGGFSVSSCPEVQKPSSPEALAAVAKPASKIAGSVWTAGFDCRYLAPPKDQTLITLSFDCPSVTHNLKVIQRGCHHYVSQSTAEDGPVWCLVPKPTAPDPTQIQLFEERKRLYCR